MSKYIGTPVVSLSVDTVDVSGDITATDSTPELILLNDTHEDTDGGREGKITFKGEQSGGEVTVLAQIQSGHDGTSDDEKGDLIFKTNDGSDGASPTEAMRISSGQKVGIGTNDPTHTLTINSADEDHIRLENGSEIGFIKLMDDGDINIWAHGSENIKFLNGTGSGTERMRIDSSGKVGIGTDSGTGKLTVQDSSLPKIQANYNGAAHLEHGVGGSGCGFSMTTGHFMTFNHQPYANAGSDTNLTERMRIDSSGNLLVGHSATFDSTDAGNGNENRFGFIGGTLNVDRNGAVAAAFKRTSSNGTLISLNRGGSGTVGSISVTTGAAAFNTSSDYRLKENVTDVTDGITRIKQLAPKRFNFIVDADTTVEGFLAHEAATVVPEAVTGTKDAMKDEDYTVTAAKGDIYTPATDDADEVVHSSNVEQPDTLAEGQRWRETAEAVMGTRSVPDMQGIDQSKLVPLLTAALQEAIAKIETLETKVAALEGE